MDIGYVEVDILSLNSLLKILSYIFSYITPGCTTYLKARATNKSGTKVEGHNGDLGLCSQ